MPLLVIFAILLVITPFLTLYLLVKYGKLRADLDESKEELARQNRTFQREIADLKKQIISAGTAVSAPAEKPPQQPFPPVAVPPKEVPVPPSRVDFPPPVQVPPSAAQLPQKAPTPPARPTPKTPPPVAPSPAAK